MASFALTDAYVKLDTQELSSFVRGGTINLEQELVDDTNMGDTSKVHILGYKDGDITIQFTSDYSAATDSSRKIWSIWAGGVAVAFEIRPKSDAVAATNPSYTGNCILTSWSPISGNVGDHAEFSANFKISGVVARNES
jgi:hypothetical protein